ncbi:MAG: peptide chain release factor N(5)-glutamine methyltransferase [Ruminococcus sp.]|nr:peptide chain release factor N(5)-glutamine methyltransferase [Ruminococcus sp.]
MNIKEAISFIKEKLLKAGTDDPAFDTIYLFEHVLSMNRTQLSINGDKELSESDFSTLLTLADRRINGEPVQYIIGFWEFMGRKFYVGEGVLIPRDDTEVLVRACLELLKGKENLNIIDLCSGSGIIAVTLKKAFENATVSAVEKSEAAFGYLTKNCEENKVQINAVCGDLFLCADDYDDNSFDLLVSNPPYIIRDEIKTLQKEVQFEPKLALDGGEDGYDFYKGIIKLWSRKLRKGGYIAFEIDEGQFECISKLLLENGFTDVKGYLDLGNTVRAMSAIYNS